MPKLKFILQKEEENKINILDITIRNDHDNLTFDIYRKPTTNDIIIQNDFGHPREHKTAAIRYYNRMTYKVNHENQQKENNELQEILINNK